MDSFYIVATNPYTFSWSYTNKVTDILLCPFIYKNNNIISKDNNYYLYINGSDISFTLDKSKASNITLENTSISTNFKITVDNKYYIRHKFGTLFAEIDDKTSLFKSDSTWIFIPDTKNYDHNFVIARYNENVSWTRYLPGRVTIYNKGNTIPHFDRLDNINIQQIQNVGREGHTYLYYILENYNKLPDRVTFLQGNPFPHSENLLELCCMESDYSDFQCLSSWYLKNKLPPTNVINNFIQYKNGAKFALYPINSRGNFLDCNDDGLDLMLNSYRIDKNVKILDRFLECILLSNKINDIYLFSMTGLFSVNKQTILNNLYDTYSLTLSNLLSKNNQGGFEGYILEKLWYTIFSPNKYNNDNKEFILNNYINKLSLTHLLIKRQSKTLCIIFSSMAYVTYYNKNTFQIFSHCKEHFSNFDLLFIKDTNLGEWYLNNYINNIIILNEFINNFSYESVVCIGVSSGAFAVLNIGTQLVNFKGGWCFNGLSDISEFIDKNNKYTTYNDICYTVISDNITNYIISNNMQDILSPCKNPLLIPKMNNILWDYNSNNKIDYELIPPINICKLNPIALKSINHHYGIIEYTTHHLFKNHVYPYLLSIL